MFTRTQLTGLSDSCRRHVVTLTGKAAILAAQGTTPGGSPSSATATTTDSLTTYDPATGIETETITSSAGGVAQLFKSHAETVSKGIAQLSFK